MEVQELHVRGMAVVVVGAVLVCAARWGECQLEAVGGQDRMWKMWRVLVIENRRVEVEGVQHDERRGDWVVEEPWVV